MAQYKVEFLPADFVVEKGETQVAASRIESIINKYASQGWQLSQISQISVSEKPGCLAGIFGRKAVNVNYNMIIFVK